MKCSMMGLALLLFLGAGQTLTGKNEVPLDQEFTLKIGQQAVVQNTKLKIRFADVLEDSRCPEGVECIWEGNGKVNLELKKSAKKLISVLVNTGREPRAAEYRGYTVRLVKLSPSPKAGEVIDPSQYEATLVASKNKPPRQL